jgi:hypothetical protein
MRQFAPIWLLALSLAIGCSRGVQLPMYGQVPPFRHVSRSFKLGGVDSTLRHHTHLVLVDRASRIRGYYSTCSGDRILQLVADARRLLS